MLLLLLLYVIIIIVVGFVGVSRLLRPPPPSVLKTECIILIKKKEEILNQLNVENIGVLAFLLTFCDLDTLYNFTYLTHIIYMYYIIEK